MIKNRNEEQRTKNNETNAFAPGNRRCRSVSDRPGTERGRQDKLARRWAPEPQPWR